MATIRKRKDSCHVQIRKRGYPSLTNSFNARSTALAWAKKVASKIDRHIYYKPEVSTRPWEVHRFQHTVQ